MAKQSEPKKQNGEKPGKYHYNPVNMSGKKAGIIEKVKAEEAAEEESDAKSGAHTGRPTR